MGKNAEEYPLRGAILKRAEGGRSARRATTDPTIRHPFPSGREMRGWSCPCRTTPNMKCMTAAPFVYMALNPGCGLLTNCVRPGQGKAKQGGVASDWTARGRQPTVAPHGPALLPRPHPRSRGTDPRSSPGERRQLHARGRGGHPIRRLVHVDEPPLRYGGLEWVRRPPGGCRWLVLRPQYLHRLRTREERYPLDQRQPVRLLHRAISERLHPQLRCRAQCDRQPRRAQSAGGNLSHVQGRGEP